MEIRRSYDRLISTMGFPVLVRRDLYIESGPRCLGTSFDIMPDQISNFHDDVVTWKHLPYYLSLCAENHRPSVIPSQKRQVMRVFVVFCVASLNKLLDTLSSCRSFKTPWHTCDGTVMFCGLFTKNSLYYATKVIIVQTIRPDWF